jgi:hypothetical protein
MNIFESVSSNYYRGNGGKMQSTIDRIETLLANKNLSEWDSSFLLSLQRQVEKRGSLSERQLDVLTTVEGRYTDLAISSRLEWKESYTGAMSDIARVCASYYITTGYFHDLSYKVLHEDGYIPSEKQWRSLCNNKYAMKVREAAFNDPKFPVGEMVMVRSSTPGEGYPLAKYRDCVGTSLAIVISDNEQIISASRGCRRYKIVFVGDSTPQFAEERDIKKLPKKYQKK